MKVAVIGATGMVGRVMLKVLQERNFPVSELILVASEKSIGKMIEFAGKEYSIVGIKKAIAQRPDIALFSAGGASSKEWAPQFAAAGTVVIDNSSVWRMDSDKKLIVPEVNGDVLTANDKIIANPNCSTIQLVMALAPLQQKYRIKRLVISTYQSVTGTGVKGVQQLTNERNNVEGEMVYPWPIDQNCLPHGGDFDETGYTTEELKLVDETRKILRDSTIAVTATVVRVPVMGGHSESVNVEFKNDFTLSDVRHLLHQMPGITLQDNPDINLYPMPAYAEDKDDVFVGRIRRDESTDNALNMWVVSDNLRKGAATNAVQIAEYLVKHNLVKVHGAVARA